MKSIFSLSRNPWLFMFLYMLSWVICNILITNVLRLILRLGPNAQVPSFWVVLLTHILTIFIVVPFVLGFPGKSHSYADFLSEIRLTKVQPLLILIMLALSCYLIMALSQAAGVLVHRLTQGLPVDWSFIRSAFVLANELPPRSTSWLESFPSIFEEVAWRGVFLALFLRLYDQPKAILFAAIGFGLMHTLNLLAGRPPVWIAGQVAWAVVLGLFYGYVTVKTGSLLPAILVHYLGNLFIAAINAYIQNNASVPVQALYGFVFTFGIVPTTLMILWTRLFSNWWPVIQKP